MVTMLAWHNNPRLKAEVVQRIKAHRAADAIVQGVYQEYDSSVALKYRGCAIGCTLPWKPAPYEEWYDGVESLYNIPRDISQLIDVLFEHLPTEGDQHAEFAVRVIESIPVGADLSRVLDQLSIDLVTDSEWGLRRWITAGSPQSQVLDRVVELYQLKLSGEKIPYKNWVDTSRDIVMKVTQDTAVWGTDPPVVAGLVQYAVAGVTSGESSRFPVWYVEAVPPGFSTWIADRFIYRLFCSPTDFPRW